VLRCVDTIDLGNFDAHLLSKGFSNEAITFFSVLKDVQIGSREMKEFIQNQTNASVEKIGVAVKRENDNSMKIAILWVKMPINLEKKYGYFLKT
jgi:hypothetical protein